MRQLYNVYTYYQLITAIQIKLKIYAEYEADIIVHDHSNNANKIADRLKEMKIFKNVYFAKSYNSFFKNNSLLKKIKKTIQIISYYNITDKCCSINNYMYDELLFYNFDYFINCLYYRINKANPDIVCKRFEEGWICSTDFNISPNCRGDKLQYFWYKLFNNPIITENIDQMLFYEPELVMFKNKCELKAIPKLNKNDTEIKMILNKLFNYSSSHEYDRKYIFFEEAYFKDGIEMDDLDLVLKIANKVGKENFMVKLHPRSNVDRFAEYGIKTNKNLEIPWEVIIMNNDLSDKVFITISSGSVLSPRIIFGEKSPTYMLFNCSKFRRLTINDNFFEYLTKFENKFGSEGFYIPDDFNDFLKKL